MKNVDFNYSELEKVDIALIISDYIRKKIAKLNWWQRLLVLPIINEIVRFIDDIIDDVIELNEDDLPQ